MCSARILPLLLFLLTVTLLPGCGDNLFPSGSDQRPAVTAGSSGPSVGQQVVPFTVSDITGSSVALATALAGRKAVVLYFTMWCPICDEQAAQLQTKIPSNPDVGFYLVDYVSGTLADAGSAALANGFTGVGFTILADTGHTLQAALQGTMGTTVVIDAAGTIRLNEDFRDGTRLESVLAGITNP